MMEFTYDYSHPSSTTQTPIRSDQWKNENEIPMTLSSSESHKTVNRDLMTLEKRRLVGADTLKQTYFLQQIDSSLQALEP